MKAKLRRELRAKRRSFNAAEHAHRSHSAASFIARLPAFKSGSRVAIYLPFDGETDPSVLLGLARLRRIRVFVPVVSHLRHRRLRFHPLTRRTQRGTFGISIPRRAAPRNAVAPRWFDLIVIPLVGVDRDGRRLGMGGGFYDRALAFRRGRRHWRGPLLVGLAFDCQRADSVRAEPFDVRLDALATESGIQHFSRDTQ